jgi:hypothetical protein
MSVPLSPLPGRDQRRGCLLHSILDCIALVVMEQVFLLPSFSEMQNEGLILVVRW